MDLRSTRRHWNKLAQTDPFWAVLTAPDKQGNRWQVEEFFAHGRAEVTAKLAAVRQLYPALRTGAALDFGCGVGRLSQALAEHFEHVTGLDLSERMLELAQSHNRHGMRVCYRHNPHPDLRMLPANSFDLVLSLITLQHMEPSYAQRYLAEFVRVAAPGGILLFQVPAAVGPPPRPRSFTLWPDTLSRRLVRHLRRHLAIDPVMEMHALPRAVVEATLQAAGAEMLQVECDSPADSELVSLIYLARKR